jgi:hypothetical protein
MIRFTREIAGRFTPAGRCIDDRQQQLAGKQPNPNNGSTGRLADRSASEPKFRRWHCLQWRPNRIAWLWCRLS